MASEHSQFRQRATAIYLIDFLALRVGNEKDASEVADTVSLTARMSTIDLYDIISSDTLLFPPSL
jgi:DNA topoisomerase IB